MTACQSQVVQYSVKSTTSAVKQAHPLAFSPGLGPSSPCKELKNVSGNQNLLRLPRFLVGLKQVLLPMLDSTDSFPGPLPLLYWQLLDGKTLLFLYLGHMPPYQVTSQDHWLPLTPSGRIQAWSFCPLLSEESHLQGKIQ